MTETQDRPGPGTSDKKTKQGNKPSLKLKSKV